MEHSEKEKPTGSGISIETLLIAAVASAVASFLASRLWGAGTLLSAAVTPVVVAVISEFIRRPVQRVGSAARTPTMPRFSDRTSPRSSGETDGQDEPDHPVGPTSPAVSAGGSPSPPSPPPGPVAPGEPGPIRVYSSRRRWRVALVTGLAAFVLVVAVYTITDALAGHAITGGGGGTTFFGGSGTTQSHTTTTTKTSATTTTTLTKTKTTSTSPKRTSSSSSTSSSASQTSPTTSSSSTSSSRTAPAAKSPAPASTSTRPAP